MQKILNPLSTETCIRVKDCNSSYDELVICLQGIHNVIIYGLYLN